MAGSKKGRRRTTGAVVGSLAAGVMAVGLVGVDAGAAQAATPGVLAVFSGGVLVVRGEVGDDVIAVSRDAAGAILVNGGSVPITGTPTVANTTAMIVLGEAGSDTITIDEASGALPRSILVGGEGNDVMTGGSGIDLMAGQAGNDTMLGKGSFDQLVGGPGNDTLTGGDADDQVLGGAGDDRMIWNPGDDTDLNEGGDGRDLVEVNGGGGAEEFTETPNGARVRFDRVSPAPFSIDIGTSEGLLLRMNGGDDSFTGSTGLAPLIGTTVDGGTGKDTILGTDGADFLIGGDDDDLVDGNRGNDLAALGSGDDRFQWDPGDGSDSIEGQAGIDTMTFDGAGVAEDFDLRADGGRARFFRNVGSITMGTNDVELIDVAALGGADNLTVGDLTGTDVTHVTADLSAAGGGDDSEADSVSVEGTGGDDVAVVSGGPSSLDVVGLAASVTVTGASPATDQVAVRALAGDDVIDASGVAVGAAKLTLDGGDGHDVLIGGDGDDTIDGGAGDDVLIGGPGLDVLDGGPDDNVIIQAIGAPAVVDGVPVSASSWLQDHVHEVAGATVVEHRTKQYPLPAADLVR